MRLVHHPRLLSTQCAMLLGALLGSVVVGAPALRAEIRRTTYLGRVAYKLTDGKTEAAVVPSLGRVMRYGRVGGRNWLWNNSKTQWKSDEWRNWGGDKTWIAPQIQWRMIYGRPWPPDEAIDGAPHEANVKKNVLQTVSPISRFSGVRVVREYSYDAEGDFVVRQTLEKVQGSPMFLSIWSVMQIATPDAMYVPLNAQSPYKNNFHWLSPVVEGVVTHSTPTLLEIVATTKSGYKVGSDAPQSALAAVKGDEMLLIRTPKPGGDYPDGALGAGLPVEIYNNSAPAELYNELELLSPQHLLHKGSAVTHSMKWRIVNAGSTTPEDRRARAEQLLQTPFGSL